MVSPPHSIEVRTPGFRKTVSPMWAMTLLSLYVRVHVTILGIHLYLDFAQCTNGAQLQAESDAFNGNGHKTFVTMDDYLVSDTITAFIVQMQHATTDVLKE
ncbi:Peroxisome biogenesis protein 3-2 [Zea mays]|uniref:Peroxisome biogenesis protein 3-2 n=1 Tax=Zea mays TaxID=4577 RepID=A0A3L6FA29_MAIZE|nr:Peroxisome biogenesis protein 3-2 [Zea mays]